MDLTEYGILLRYMFMPWLFAMFGVVLYRLGRSGLSFRDLVCSHHNGTVNPDRLLTLATVIFVAASYILIVLSEGPIRLGEGQDVRHAMPDIPETLLLILGGAQGTYVGKKIFDRAKGG